MWSYIVQGVVLGLYAAATPGPFQAFLFSETLRVGWKRTLPAAFAPLGSDAPVLCLFLLVLSQLPDKLLSALQVGGGLFMLYLAWGVLKSVRSGGSQAAAEQDSSPRSLWKASLMNLLNPNVYIFWGTIGAPIVLKAWETSLAWGWGFILVFYAVLIPALAGTIVLFGTVGRLKASVQRGILAGLALLLVGFGIFQIWHGAGALIA